MVNFSQISFSLKRNPVICLVIFQREFLPFSPHPWRTTIFLQRKVSANFSHNPHPRLEVSAKFSRNKSGFFHVFSSVGIREKIHFFLFLVVLTLAEKLIFSLRMVSGKGTILSGDGWSPPEGDDFYLPGRVSAKFSRK